MKNKETKGGGSEGATLNKVARGAMLLSVTGYVIFSASQNANSLLHLNPQTVESIQNLTNQTVRIIARTHALSLTTLMIVQTLRMMKDPTSIMRLQEDSILPDISNVNFIGNLLLLAGELIMADYIRY